MKNWSAVLWWQSLPWSQWDSETTPAGVENCLHCRKVWKHQNMQAVKETLIHHNTKFMYQDWRLCGNWWKFIKTKERICSKTWMLFIRNSHHFLHISTKVSFDPFTESHKGSLSKFREVMVGRLSKMFTHRTLFDEIHSNTSKNVCKFFVGKDASQLYTNLTCQPLPRRLYRKYKFDAEVHRVKLSLGKVKASENISCSTSSERYQIVKMRALKQQQLKKDWFFNCRLLLWIL